MHPDIRRPKWLSKERKRFSEYRNSVFGQGDKYGSSYSSEALAEINRVLGARDETTGIMGAIGAIYESALHLQSPLEYLFPLSPESKFNPKYSITSPLVYSYSIYF